MSTEEELRNLRLFDRRTIERSIKRGVVTRKDYEKHLKSLADASDKLGSPGPAGSDADDLDETE